MQKDKYKKYKITDFLKDDDFLRWNLFKSKEDNAYWEGIIEKFPDLKPSIVLAIKLFETQIQLNDYSLTTEQIEVYHDALRRNITKLKKRRALHLWLSAAASVIILFSVNYIFKPFNKQESRLVSFIKTSSFAVDSISKDIQLYVSSDQLITIEEKEADISYHTDSITVTGKSFAKESTMEYSQLIVPKGKRSRLILSDGTLMHVNSGTKVVYPHHFTDNTREIYVDGEVFLNVVHNHKQPFIVRTNEISIRVTGTQFNVQAYKEDAQTQVVLAEGAVQIIPNIHSHSRKVSLVPSQMYDCKDGESSVKNVNVKKYTSWIQGMIHVEDERLDVLMTKLSRYYGKSIIFDDGLGNQRCTGKVDLKDDLADVLDGLTFTFQIKVEQIDNTFMVTTR